MHRPLFLAFALSLISLIVGASACGSCAGDEQTPTPQKSTEPPATGTAPPKQVRMPFPRGMLGDAAAATD